MLGKMYSVQQPHPNGSATQMIRPAHKTQLLAAEQHLSHICLHSPFAFSRRQRRTCSPPATAHAFGDRGPATARHCSPSSTSTGPSQLTSFRPLDTCTSSWADVANRRLRAVRRAAGSSGDAQPEAWPHTSPPALCFASTDSSGTLAARTPPARQAVVMPELIACDLITVGPKGDVSLFVMWRVLCLVE